MDRRRPSFWRAFWITAAIVGGVNTAFFVCVRSLPDAPLGKGGRMMKPTPEWSLPLLVINFPGLLVQMPFYNAQNLPTSESAALHLAGAQAISTIFWGW